MTTQVTNIQNISTTLTFRDRFGFVRMRLGIGRASYKIEPGIYAVGNPDSMSPVLVSSNYKMSFDVLRRELFGIDAWILVIDTRGINVWCAARFRFRQSRFLFLLQRGFSLRGFYEIFERCFNSPLECRFVHRLRHVQNRLPPSRLCLKRQTSRNRRPRRLHGMRRLREELPRRGNQTHPRRRLRHVYPADMDQKRQSEVRLRD